MDELKIGEVIFSLRKERGLTQEEFGNIVGVSKGAVSKWEVGATYPDIVLLPRIAKFFNISIDRLMNFNSDIDDEKVREIYNECAKEAAKGNYKTTISKCEEYLKKYSRNYKLKLMLASAMTIGSALIKDAEKLRNTKNKIMKIYSEVMENSKNQEEVEAAILVLATFYGDEEEYSKAYLILDRIKKYNKEALSIRGTLLLREGKVKEARKIHQEILLSSVGNIGASIMAICKSYEGDLEKQIELLDIIEKFYKVFTRDQISKGLSNIYLAKAEIYAKNKNAIKTLENINLLGESINSEAIEMINILTSEIEKENSGLDGREIVNKMIREQLEDEKYDFVREEGEFGKVLERI